MGIGASILLIAAGAILAFAVQVSVPHVDLVTVGVILMAAGGLGLVATVAILAPRRQRAVAPPYDPAGRPRPAEHYPPAAGYRDGYDPAGRDGPPAERPAYDRPGYAPERTPPEDGPLY